MYCSAVCYQSAQNLERRKGGYVTCETCGKEFYVTRARLRQVQRQGASIRYCSMACYQKEGDKNPFWGKRHKEETKVKWVENPNRYVFASGKANPNYRRWEYVPYKRQHPSSARRVLRLEVKLCSRCGWNEALECLQVHHKDRDETNNAKENLEVLCPNCHELEHFRSKDGRWRKKKKKRKAPPVTYEEL